MGQIVNPKNNMNILEDFICYKCGTHILIELIQNKYDILIRQYCFCGSFTSNIDVDIFSIINFDFYKGFICHTNTTSPVYITKYCYKCHVKTFLCDECALKHKHQTFINAKDYINNCKYHRECKLIGFCKNCKLSFCEKCIKNKLHLNHEVKYPKDLQKNMKEILETYISNLNKAYNEINKLIKMKYGKKYNLKIRNLFQKEKRSFFDKEDQNTILCLELLKTFLDLYIYKEKNNNLNYQAISHIVKHRDFEIIQLKETEKKINNSQNSRIISIGSDKQDIQIPKNPISLFKNKINWKKKEDRNENISLYLRIKIKEEEIRKNEINLLMDKKLEISIFFSKKIIALKDGNLALLCGSYKIIFLKNLQIWQILKDKDIVDFIQLENEKLCVLKLEKVIIYNINNYNFIKEKEIIFNDYKEFYYSLKHISDNNMAFLSYKKEYFFFFKFF